MTRDRVYMECSTIVDRLAGLYLANVSAKYLEIVTVSLGLDWTEVVKRAGRTITVEAQAVES